MENYLFAQLDRSNEGFEALADRLCPALWSAAAQYFPEAISDGYAIVLVELWKIHRNEKLAGWNPLTRLPLALERARRTYWAEALGRREAEETVGDGEAHRLVDLPVEQDTDALLEAASQGAMRDEVLFPFDGCSEQDDTVRFLSSMGFDVGNATRVSHGPAGDVVLRAMLVALPVRTPHSRRRIEKIIPQMIFTAALSQLHTALFWLMAGRMVPMDPWASQVLQVTHPGTPGWDSRLIRTLRRAQRRGLTSPRIAAGDEAQVHVNYVA